MAVNIWRAIYSN